MEISRRAFLSGSAASVATLLSFRPTKLIGSGLRSEGLLDCALLDLKSHCALRESLQGYQAALGEEYKLVETVSGSTCHFRIVIVPGLGLMDPALAQTLSDLLKSGTHLLLESGAGFFNPAEFSAHQKMLRHYFDLEVLSPVALWSEKSVDDSFCTARRGLSPGDELNGREFIPYINYVWPKETKVRDFSRVIPVSGRAGDVIGKVGALPVAIKKRTANGTLIFLGSPLGPVLRYRDPEARSWLRLVTTL